MPDSVELFEKLQKYTGMYVMSETYGAVCAFVSGYDIAHEGGVLIGFREWLALKCNASWNLSWPALVLEASGMPSDMPIDDTQQARTMHRRAVDAFFQLFFTFVEERRVEDGLAQILGQYVHRRKVACD